VRVTKSCAIRLCVCVTRSSATEASWAQQERGQLGLSSPEEEEGGAADFAQEVPHRKVSAVQPQQQQHEEGAPVPAQSPGLEGLSAAELEDC
jgi:hypothetical protein